MRSYLGPFLFGVIAAIVAIIVGACVFILAGGVSMAASAKPLPLEAAVAGMALRASYGRAADLKSPLPLDDANLLSGAREYRQTCAVCHGTSGQPASAIAKGMYPPPPQLFEPQDMMTSDPEGIAYWTVTNGIRLTGMPGFGSTLSDTTRWQLTMLVAHADKLSPAVQAALKQH